MADDKAPQRKPRTRNTSILVPMDEVLKRDFTEKAASRGWNVTAVIRALMRAWSGEPPDIPGEEFVEPGDVEFEMQSADKRPRTKPTNQPKRKKYVPKK